MTLNLGNSYPTYANIPVLQVISQGQDKLNHLKFNSLQERKISSVNIYSRTYKSPSKADSRDIANYGKDDPYTATESNYQYPSMLVSSAIIGLIGITISYLIAVPLGSYMARFKNTWIDSSLTGLLTFLFGPTQQLPWFILFA